MAPFPGPGGLLVVDNYLFNVILGKFRVIKIPIDFFADGEILVIIGIEERKLFRDFDFVVRTNDYRGAVAFHGIRFDPDDAFLIRKNVVRIYAVAVNLNVISVRLCKFADVEFHFLPFCVPGTAPVRWIPY